MASKFASNRHFLLCPICQKTQACLSVHLTRVCMKRSSKEAIRDVLQKEKQDSLDILQWGRVFNYGHIRQILDSADPADRLIKELERRHMVVTDMPQSPVMGWTSTVPAAKQPPERSEGEQAEEVTQEVQWPQKSRQLMAEKGLYRKHSLDHPLLKGFATYLQRDLQNENFKQEVENVARFLFYMKPQEPSLEFVKEREKTRLFFSELTEAKLTKQTQINYLKSLKRFLKYHTIDTDLRSNNEKLWRDAKHFIEYLGLLQQNCAKLVSKEITHRRHAILREKDPLTLEDCWAVLRAANNDFLTVLSKVFPENGSLQSTECCLVLYYLEAIVILKHLQRPGVVEHMTVEDWMTRTTDKSGYAVICVKEHETSAQQAACFALPREEEMWFDIYFTRVRPQLLECKRSQLTKDDLRGDERFFISTSGRPILNASNDLNRLHQKYKLANVTSQTARRVFEAATKTMTDSEKLMVADYLTHSTATADRHYRMKQSQNVVLVSKLLGKLAGNSSAESAGEGTSRGAWAAARDPAIGSNQQMDVHMAFDLLLQTHPVTLDGVMPDRAARCQVSEKFQRQLNERWLKAQMRLRVQHVLSHFGRREPKESWVSTWIRKQGWRSNIPSAARILKGWKPTGSMDSVIDSSHIKSLITTQKWRGLVVTDIAGKGKGVCTRRSFQSGEVVCDYHGQVVTAAEGKHIHHNTDEEDTGYMFFFCNKKNQQMCIDAHSPECQCHPGKETFGRLINHSRKRANLKPRLYTVEIDGEERDVILFFAEKKLEVGEELRFDYGGQRKSFRGEGLDLDWL